MASTTLILGGARSGKSRHAETLALSRAASPVYIATAEAWDDEMRSRIAAHRERRRGQGWHAVETPFDLAETIALQASVDRVVLVDCLTLWLTNLMMSERAIEQATNDLLTAIAAAPGEIILVSNEVGFGIVPENAMARRFRDLAGKLHQDIAAQADNVLLMVAGLPVVVKTAN